MNCRRKHSRLKFDSKCLVMGRDEEAYPALLDDLSLGGALIRVEVENPFKVGDLCDLMLSKRSAKFPIKHACEVVRHDNEIIGVRFLT